MADPSRSTTSALSQQPPPPPPLPPQRPSVYQRLIAPLAFTRPQRQQETSVVQSASASPKDVSQDRPQRRPHARNAVHRTGISINAIDVNDQSTHAILAGSNILKTVRVSDTAIHEDFNIRNSVNTYNSIQQLRPEEIHKRSEYLPAKDVRWSHGSYSHVVATAANNGRIALYDVSSLGSSRVELSWLWQHTGQVNKLDFDPHKGYLLLSGSQDKYCKIWDIRDPRNPSGYQQYNINSPVRDVRWSPTNAFEFALCTEKGVVQLWDVRNPNQFLKSINAHIKSCYTLAWHPDGRHLASGGNVDRFLRIWDMKSELRGQKPVLQVSCPHGIMNLAWRPPAWSAEFAKRGTWQTCHIATSYDDNDPRTHIWDLRRHLLPCRELNLSDTRPRDLLWASKDLLWTAGWAGHFIQSDVSYAPQVEDSLPPGDIEWAPDGTFYAVVENRSAKHQPSTNEPSAVFLNVPKDKLSGVEDGTTSRSLTDEESTDTSFAEHTSRRQSRSTAAARTKSHPNTPPANDSQPKVLPLDRSIVGKRELFINGQIGNMTRLPGIYTPRTVTEFIANNYARPMTAKERSEAPEKILPCLEKAFKYNSKVCDVVEMPHVAASWKLMAEIIIPELKSWADNNRKNRLDKAEQDRIKEEASKNNDRDTLSPLPKLTPHTKDGKSPARSEKITSNLFRGVVESHRGSSDSGIHGGSNMTTPRQLPLPNSPATSKKDASIWFTLDDAIEPIQPLPPSLANSHSTAAIASRTLLDNNSEPSQSPMSSPEKPRSPERLRSHKRSATETAVVQVAGTDQRRAPVDQARPTYINRNQEDRRAALRDYRASTRQPFSLETTGFQQGRESRHDSSESFPMFSASGGSSARARSLGRSFDTNPAVEMSSRSRQDSDDWFNKEGYSLPLGPSKEEIEESTKVQESPAEQTADSAVDESPSLPFSLDGASQSMPVPNDIISNQFKKVLARDPPQQKERKPRQVKPEIKSRTTDAGRLEGGLLAREYHLTNPFVHEADDVEQLRQIPESDISMSSAYRISDFRPIDITKYETMISFAVSTHPVVSDIIQIDVDKGFAAGQFSAHLLGHIHPFFFHQSFRKSPTTDDLYNSTTLASRLMNPALSSRLIENIFATHIEYLRKLDLYVPAAEFRKLCVEDFDFPHLAGPEARTESGSVGDQLKIDPLKLKASCSSCKSLLAIDATSCKNCSARVGKCPICEMPFTRAVTDANLNHDPYHPASSMTTYCHICGHSVHLPCMSTWLSLADTQGECPVGDCGCGCGPGLLRNQRIAAQIEANENAANNRGPIATNVKRDSRVVGPNPAVDKARDTLRKRAGGFGERATDRERGPDERATPSSGGSASTGGGPGTSTSTSAWSRKGTSAGQGRAGPPSLGRSNSGGVSGASVGVGSASASLGRRVRVVEPDK